jgi:hypothetical protein
MGTEAFPFGPKKQKVRYRLEFHGFVPFGGARDLPAPNLKSLPDLRGRLGASRHRGVTVGRGERRAAVRHHRRKPGSGDEIAVSPPIVEALLSIAWWDWPIDKVSRNLAAIVGADVDALRANA